MKNIRGLGSTHGTIAKQAWGNGGAKKCPIVRNEFLKMSSYFETCEFLVNNGPHGLRQYNQNLSVSYGDNEKDMGLPLGGV